MKIGHVDTKKIPLGESVHCENGCSAEATHYFNETPFCAECLHEAQQMQWAEDGNFIEYPDGERIYFKDVRRVTVMVPL